MLAKRIGVIASAAGLLISGGIILASYPYSPSKGDLLAGTYLLIITSLISLVCIFIISPSKTDSSNLLSLWIKRKRLEEQQRIKSLQDKK